MVDGVLLVAAMTAALACGAGVVILVLLAARSVMTKLGDRRG